MSSSAQQQRKEQALAFLRQHQPGVPTERNADGRLSVITFLEMLTICQEVAMAFAGVRAADRDATGGLLLFTRTRREPSAWANAIMDESSKVESKVMQHLRKAWSTDRSALQALAPSLGGLWRLYHADPSHQRWQTDAFATEQQESRFLNSVGLDKNGFEIFHLAPEEPAPFLQLMFDEGPVGQTAAESENHAADVMRAYVGSVMDKHPGEHPGQFAVSLELFSGFKLWKYRHMTAYGRAVTLHLARSKDVNLEPVTAVGRRRALAARQPLAPTKHEQKGSMAPPPVPNPNKRQHLQSLTKLSSRQERRTGRNTEQLWEEHGLWE